MATAVMMLVAGCRNSQASSGGEPLTPTEAPTEIPTDTATPAPILLLTHVSPNHATAGQVSLDVCVSGDGIGETPYVFLTHRTHGEIEATDVKVYGGRKVCCTFDLSDAEPGTWSVEVINPDGLQGELDDALEIIAPTPTPTSTPSPTPTATSTPSPTPTATFVVVTATSMPSPTPTAMPIAENKTSKLVEMPTPTTPQP